MPRLGIHVSVFRRGLHEHPFRKTMRFTRVLQCFSLRQFEEVTPTTLQIVCVSPCPPLPSILPGGYFYSRIIVFFRCGTGGKK